MDRPVTAPYTAAELAAISARAEAWTGAPERELFPVADVRRLVAELTRTQEALCWAMQNLRPGLDQLCGDHEFWKARAALGEEPADGDTER
jgi:hypothetical protein